MLSNRSVNRLCRWPCKRLHTNISTSLLGDTRSRTDSLLTNHSFMVQTKLLLGQFNIFPLPAWYSHLNCGSRNNLYGNQTLKALGSFYWENGGKRWEGSWNVAPILPCAPGVAVKFIWQIKCRYEIPSAVRILNHTNWRDLTKLTWSGFNV